jgi:hypothetical protein
MDDNPITDRQATIDGLRALADWCEAHPTAKAPFAFVNESVFSREEMVAKAREFGGRWDKAEKGEWFELRQEFGPKVVVEISALRQQVCERVLVSSRQVEVAEPDPDMVAQLPQVKRTETVEDYGWECPSSLLSEIAAHEAMAS